MRSKAVARRKAATLPPGQIDLACEVHDDRVAIEVEDNGQGLPHEDRERLFEPYVTTRAKGTGLGLAIVKKIMEEHGGELVLEDRPLRRGRPGPSGDPPETEIPRRPWPPNDPIEQRHESLWRMTF